ncbi:hypothetical protein KIP88_40380 [Bradyrhizobium sp. SRL28]|uniref:hypothetical protein n=1 Tax=Bradyrhizobium sp. SRL28 TaxID=2836178 RepID=UPI001BDDF3B5|nr:hypothetical protein [Bradyrhizobium sp. SRL28]MBT1516680.1 hypothetical protein [Bradyrhizobium sp. SRL28]
MTTLFVTHDQDEALTLADRIVVMNKGAVEQIGSPEEVYDAPATRFVAEFIGQCSLLEGQILDEGKFRTDDGLAASFRPGRKGYRRYQARECKEGARDAGSARSPGDDRGE